MIKNFKLFLESEKPVISYDFDGVLHKSVIDHHPIGFSNPDQWEPFAEMHAQMRKEHADGNKIVVISARDDHDQRYIWDFIKKYDLPVEEVYTTNDESKIPYLEKVDAVKHYDDKDIRDEVESIGVEFSLVDPVKGVFEGINSIRLYEFTLRNNSFYISDNTVESFANAIKKVDPNMFYNKRENGTIKNARILYIRSLGMDKAELNKAIGEFEKRYDHLKIEYVVK